MSTARPPLGVAGKSVLVLGGALPAIATGTITVMLPRISDAFDGTHHALLVKMVATAAGLGMMLGAPLGGILADAIGPRIVLMAAVGVFSAFGLLAMLTASLWQLIIVRFGIGFASGAMTATYFAVIADNFDTREQGRWVGYNAAMATVLVVAFAPIAGLLTDTGWRHGFLVYTLGLPILVLAFIGIPGGAAVVEATQQGPHDTIRPRISIPWRTVLLATVGGTLAAGTGLYWPFRLRELGVTSARDLSLYYIPNILILALASFCYGRIRRKLSVTQVFAVSGLLSGLGVTIMALGPTIAMVAVGLLIEGLAIGIMTPNLAIYAISIAPPHARARVVGLMKGVYYGSPFVTQFPLEALNHAAGVPAALLGIAAMSAGMGVIMALKAETGARAATAS